MGGEIYDNDSQLVLHWKQVPGSHFGSDSGSGARHDISVFYASESGWYPVCLIGDSLSSTNKTCLLVKPDSPKTD